MKTLLYGDTFPQLVRNLREFPGIWVSRLVFLLGPWVCLWMVEILNENDVFEDLAAWQVLMNLVWYYSLFVALRLLLGRNRRAAALSTVLAFLFGLCAPLPGTDFVPRGCDRLAYRRQCG